MFDARHPDAPAAASSALSRDALLPLKVPSDVLGKVGECFAAGLGLQRSLARLDPAAPGWQAELDAVRDARSHASSRSACRSSSSPGC